jgi:hypothetical protein
MSWQHQTILMHPIYGRVSPPSAAGRSSNWRRPAYVISLTYAIFGPLYVLYKMRISSQQKREKRNQSVEGEKRLSDIESFEDVWPSRFGPIAVMIALQIEVGLGCGTPCLAGNENGWLHIYTWESQEGELFMQEKQNSSIPATHLQWD